MTPHVDDASVHSSPQSRRSTKTDERTTSNSASSIALNISRSASSHDPTPADEPTLLLKSASRPPIAIGDALTVVTISEAISNGNFSELHALLQQRGVSMASFNSPFGNLLHIAASFGTLATFKRIIQEGQFDVNSQSSEGSTPLHVASRLGRYEIVEHLLSLDGIDDTLRDIEGKTCLDCAKNRQIANIIACTCRVDDETFY